jgi:hypothetical protein
MLTFRQGKEHVRIGVHLRVSELSLTSAIAKVLSGMRYAASKIIGTN